MCRLRQIHVRAWVGQHILLPRPPIQQSLFARSIWAAAYVLAPSETGQIRVSCALGMHERVALPPRLQIAPARLPSRQGAVQHGCDAARRLPTRLTARLLSGRTFHVIRRRRRDPRPRQVRAIGERGGREIPGLWAGCGCGRGCRPWTDLAPRAVEATYRCRCRPHMMSQAGILVHEPCCRVACDNEQGEGVGANAQGANGEL